METIYKNEKQLQAACVIEFSQRHPEKAGQLWSVRNNTFSIRDGNTQKAMGMRKGVADLNFFEDGVLIGIEIKLPGSWHSREHILDQYIWGETITKEGGEYYMVTSVEGFLRVIEGGNIESDCPGVYTLREIKELLDSDRKTVGFK